MICVNFFASVCDILTNAPGWGHSVRCGVVGVDRSRVVHKRETQYWHRRRIREAERTVGDGNCDFTPWLC